VKLFDVALEARTTGVDVVVDRIDEAVSRAVAGTDPFEVEFTRFNLFPDVVYTEVEDEGRLAGLNRRLRAHPVAATLDRDAGGFIPHLTLGYPTGATDYDALLTPLEADRDLDVPALAVDRVTPALIDGGEWPPTHDHLRTYRP